jgi:hypothetical protein
MFFRSKFDEKVDPLFFRRCYSLGDVSFLLDKENFLGKLEILGSLKNFLGSLLRSLKNFLGSLLRSLKNFLGSLKS